MDTNLSNAGELHLKCVCQLLKALLIELFSLKVFLEKLFFKCFFRKHYM